MSIPSESHNADATARHKARAVHVALRDVSEYRHCMAYSQGVRVHLESLTPRVAQILAGMGYELNNVRRLSSSNSISVMIE